MSTKTAFINFLKNHARLHHHSDSLWTVTTPIPTFKKIYTYDQKDEFSVRYCPHDADQALQQQFRKHRGVTYMAKPAIANLIIPVGATVHFDPEASCLDFGKLRASKAECHSIVRIEDKSQVAYGTSSWDADFYYLNGQLLGRQTIVKPHYFQDYRGTCAGGIHFYLELDQALNHR